MLLAEQSAFPAPLLKRNSLPDRPGSPALSHNFPRESKALPLLIMTLYEGQAGSLFWLPKSICMGVFLLSWNQIIEEDRTECGKNTRLSTERLTLKWRSRMQRHRHRMIACIKEVGYVSFTSECATYTGMVKCWWLERKGPIYDCSMYSKWWGHQWYFSWPLSKQK